MRPPLALASAFAMMRRHVFASALAALVAVASAQDPLYDYSASPLTELTDANFAETVRELRRHQCAASHLAQFH